MMVCVELGAGLMGCDGDVELLLPWSLFMADTAPEAKATKNRQHLCLKPETTRPADVRQQVRVASSESVCGYANGSHVGQVKVDGKVRDSSNTAPSTEPSEQ